MTYSFILPITPKMLSKAIDISVRAVKVSGSVVHGFNKFRTYILKQLK